jgi:hypothetical protein
MASAILPYFPIVAPLNKFLNRLGQSPEELSAENLRRWAATIPRVTPLAEAPPRERVEVTGVVQKIRIDPREGTGSIEATLSDGTGEIVARWLGRQTLAGVRLGAALVMEGIIGTTPDGRRAILNPQYDLVEGPGRG